MEIRVSSHFEHRYKKLPREIKEKAKKRETIFRVNPFDGRLDAHQLHGKDDGKWSYSVDCHYRIKFIFLNGDKVLYLDIGTHDELYR